ncbi:hypothetical protein MRX96_059667 [Rhipicephalus microplus]
MYSVVFVDQTPTIKFITRAIADRFDLEKVQQVPDIFTYFEENDVTMFHALIVGPAGTPYEGGFFHVGFRLPVTYPREPPRVVFLTTDAGRVCFHPQIWASGQVTLRLLGTAPGPCEWDPAEHTIRTVLTTLKSLFTNNPLSHGGDELAYSTWNAAVMRHEAIRIGARPLKGFKRETRICLKRYRQTHAKNS